jgi:hypothetical protein
MPGALTSPARVCLDYNINTAVGEVAARSQRSVLLFHTIVGISCCNLNVCTETIIIIIININLLHWRDRILSLKRNVLPLFLWNPKIHHRIQKNRHCSLSCTKWIQSMLSNTIYYALKASFNTLLASTPRSHKWFLPFRFHG